MTWERNRRPRRDDLGKEYARDNLGTTRSGEETTQGHGLGKRQPRDDTVWGRDNLGTTRSGEETTQGRRGLGKRQPRDDTVWGRDNLGTTRSGEETT